jgi:glycosyltransferase involved in cell wall biosynthesis
MADLEISIKGFKGLLKVQHISIITPVFNGAAHIKGCIKAVIEQEYPHVEHIIVDGQSHDNTIDIIKYYAARHYHIRWLSEKDDGQVDAINKGIKMAKSPILGLLNVDDYYEPGVLKHVAEIFKTQPEPSFLAGNCNVWNADGTLQYVNKPSSLRFLDLLMGWEFYPHPVNPVAYFYHKSLHSHTGYYDKKFGAAHDLEFILRAAYIANTHYIDEILGNWRKLKGTITVKEQENGVAKQSYNRVMKSYLNRLSILQRIGICVKRPFLRYKRRINNLLTKIKP